MAHTYNLAATDLITLLNSTVTTPTEGAIIESLVSAYSASIFSSTATAWTTNGPAPTVPGGYTVTTSDTAPSGTQLELIALPSSTGVTGASFSTPTAGPETVSTAISLTTFGDVVIGAGDQYVAVTDNNTGTKSDTLIGGAYLERLVSGQGTNILVAGTGANTLIGGSGADTLIGGGDSRLVAGTGANVLKSSTLSTGNDTLIGGSNADLLTSQAGNNRLVAGSGANTLVGGSGNDTLISGVNTTFQLGTGASRIIESVSGAKETIFGGSGLDTVVLASSVTNSASSIVAGSNAFRVVDLSGTNTIVGGAGAATVVLGSGTQSNASNQTITTGAGGVRVVTTEAFANYSLTTAAGGVNTVKFSDTGQTLTINDSTGTSVTLVFGDGHPVVKI